MGRAQVWGSGGEEINNVFVSKAYFQALSGPLGHLRSPPGNALCLCPQPLSDCTFLYFFSWNSPPEMAAPGACYLLGGGRCFHVVLWILPIARVLIKAVVLLIRGTATALWGPPHTFLRQPRSTRLFCFSHQLGGEAWLGQALRPSPGFPFSSLPPSID